MFIFVHNECQPHLTQLQDVMCFLRNLWAFEKLPSFISWREKFRGKHVLWTSWNRPILCNWCLKHNWYNYVYIRSCSIIASGEICIAGLFERLCNFWSEGHKLIFFGLNSLVTSPPVWLWTEKSNSSAICALLLINQTGNRKMHHIGFTASTLTFQVFLLTCRAFNGWALLYLKEPQCATGVLHK